MKKLAQYLKKNSTDQNAFASSVGVSQATVSRLVAGTQSPSPELARRIQSETAGDITIGDWPKLADLARALSGDAA